LGLTQIIFASKASGDPILSKFALARPIHHETLDGGSLHDYADLTNFARLVKSRFHNARGSWRGFADGVWCSERWTPASSSALRQYTGV